MPAQEASTIVLPRMFVGTLPPDGIASISYVISNAGFTSAIDNTVVSAWAFTDGILRKVDQKTIGYIAKGDGRAFEGIASPIPHGKGVLCVTFTYEDKRLASMFFFQSMRPYARYGPMHEMQQFRRPVADVQNRGLCESLPGVALVHMKG
jgi:hypothetical protein